MSDLGLDSLGNLGDLLNGSEQSGKPLILPLASIKEDPEQPRKYFNEEKIQELSDSIRERGVKTPISVRIDTANSGTYIINHGARRYRASIAAGMDTIPAYVDDDYSLIDQVVENIQRDNLTPREIAEVIGRLMAEGLKKNQIATKMGKSNAFVTQHSNLLDLPDPLAEAFNSGKISDVTVVNDLFALYKKQPEVVEDLLTTEDEITRSSVKYLKDYSNSSGESGGVTETENSEDAGGDKKPKSEKVADPDKLKKAIVQVMYQGQLARLILNKRPHEGDQVWIKFEESGESESVPCSEISSIVAVIEG